MTRTIPAGEFRARCLALLDEVNETGEEIIITRRGKPVARLVPVERETWKSLIGSVTWQDDIISPIDEEWEAEM